MSGYTLNLGQILQSTGQYPAIQLTLMPLSPPGSSSQGIVIKTFLEYRFRSSVVQPISDFSFTFVYTSGLPATQFIHEGDIVLLSVNLNGQDYPLSTGIIDTVEIQVTSAGETVTIMGRDKLGQWEDQDIIQATGKILSLAISQMSPQTLFQNLAQNTRTQSTDLILQNVPNSTHNFGVSPTDSKLGAVQRFLDPLNALVWCAPNGQIVWGKPNMVIPNINVLPVLMVSQSQQAANCLSMRATKSAFTVPAQIRPILTGQEIASLQASTIFPPIMNPFAEVKRLAALGCQLVKLYVSSDQSGGDQLQLNNSASIEQNGGIVARMNAYALRDMAKDSMRILQVQAVVPGHVNALGFPFIIDTMYHIIFDRAEIDCAMYLYEAEYSLNEHEGPRCNLNFTYPNTIVAGNNYK